MKRLIIGSTILLASLSFGFQEPYDPNGGQPLTCNNYHTNSHKCLCARAMMCPMDKDGNKHPGVADPDFYKEGPNKCQTFCRKDACMCVGPCTSRK